MRKPKIRKVWIKFTPRYFWGEIISGVVFCRIVFRNMALVLLTTMVGGLILLAPEVDKLYKVLVLGGMAFHWYHSFLDWDLLGPLISDIFSTVYMTSEEAAALTVKHKQWVEDCKKADPDGDHPERCPPRPY